MLTNAPKGTKDIMMDQVYKWHYVEKKWKEICARYGFKEIRTPIFEHTELFQRGVGDTTDIVQTVCGSAADQAVLRYSLLPLCEAAVGSFKTVPPVRSGNLRNDEHGCRR